MLDVLLRRKGNDGHDARAVDRPKGRLIACHLRADFTPFPSRWKVGVLDLDGSGARWRAGIRQRGGGDSIPPVLVRGIREVGEPGEWNIKRRLFQVIEAEAADGAIRFAVPTKSVDLVVRSLSRP